MLLVGCAASPHAGQNRQHEGQPAPVAHQYDDAPAASLVFTPPVALGEAPVALSRADRQRGAFVSFDSITETWIYVRSDDRLTSDHTDRYVRQSISEKVGVSYR
jgi:hypothetical protein